MSRRRRGQSHHSNCESAVFNCSTAVEDKAIADSDSKSVPLCWVMDQPGTSYGTANGSVHTPLVGEAAKEAFLSLFKDCYFPESMYPLSSVTSTSKRLLLLRLTVTGELGSGSYARVFKCTLDDGKSKREVAVKKMQPELFKQKQDVLDFFREAELLATARRAGHANILQFIGVKISQSFAITCTNHHRSHLVRWRRVQRSPCVLLKNA